MTLIFECDLDVLKMYAHTKMKFQGQDFQKLEPTRDRQTHKVTRLIALPRCIRGWLLLIDIKIHLC